MSRAALSSPLTLLVYRYSEEFSLQYGQARRLKQTPTSRESDDPLGSPSLPIQPTSPRRPFASSLPPPIVLARLAGAHP